MGSGRLHGHDVLMSGGQPLAARGLGREYRGVTALAPLDHEWGPGVHGVLGPNGAGKSTLLGMLAGTVRPSTGYVARGGVDLSTTRLRAALRRDVGLLPQEPGWPGEFTASELVSYVGRLRGLGRRRAAERTAEVLHEVGLAAKAGVPIGRLSGGERRRAFLAQAVVHDPGLVILDEPTSGLDPVQRLRVRQLVVRLAQHRTVLLSTHLVEDMVRCAGSVLVLDAGRRVWSGTPDDLVGRSSAGVTGDGAHGATGILSAAEAALLALLDGAPVADDPDAGAVP